MTALLPDVRSARPARRTAVAAAAAALALAACDAEWGGTELGLETPATAARADSLRAAQTADTLPSLPEGPLLFAARLAPDGRARVAAVARLGPDGPADLGWLTDASSEWRQAFVDAFQAPGTRLPLYARGTRIGTLILDGVETTGDAACPPVSDGHVLTRPGVAAPDVAFAWPSDDAPPPEAVAAPVSTSRLRTFGPIMAERLLQQAGVERAFLARQADLQPVAFPGDTAAGMAATYLIADTLAPVPSTAGSSVSLFFLARFDRSDGYVSEWQRVARYDSTGGKDVLVHLGMIPAGERRLEMVRQVREDGERLAAARLDPAGGGEIVWTGGTACPVVPAPPPPGGGAP